MIEHHRYTIGKREGALLKILTEIGAGYCDVHPWPQFGDDPLEKQLDLLKMGVLTPLTQNALEFARIDAEARSRGQSVFEGLTVPESHFLIQNLDQSSERVVSQAVDEGFHTFKVKLGKDLPNELEWLKPLLQFDNTRWRLDFNGSLTAELARTLLKADLRSEAIEFCEDPATSALVSFPFPIAADWIKCQSYDYRIVKPAVDPWKMIDDSRPMIFTTYLGHPVGQAAAAFAAAHSNCDRVCGLLSHRVYPKNRFSQELSWRGPQWKNPQGTGFGFNEQLECLKWVKLL